MVVHVSVHQEKENCASSFTLELPDDTYEPLCETLEKIKKGGENEAKVEVSGEVLLAFENLTDALENVVETWDEFVEENEVDEDFVDHIDCHLNEILVHHMKMCDDVGYDVEK